MNNRIIYPIMYLLLSFLNLWPTPITTAQSPRKIDTITEQTKAVDKENEQLKKIADRNDSVIAAAATQPVTQIAELKKQIKPRIIYRYRKAPKQDTVFICPSDTTTTDDDRVEETQQVNDYVAELSKMAPPIIIHQTDTVYLKNKTFLWIRKFFTKKSTKNEHN